jgi:hypothetical protein
MDSKTHHPFLSIFAVIALFSLAITDSIVNQFSLTLNSVILISIAVLVLQIDYISKIKIGPKGFEAETRAIAERTENQVDKLRAQVDALGHATMLQQVSNMNRLVIDNPDLAKIWHGMENFSDEDIKKFFYIFVFIDAFEMIKAFSDEKPLDKSLYDVWKNSWLPDLLNSDIGRQMKDMELFKYYTTETKSILSEIQK